MTTKKQKWLIGELERVHLAIDDNLESWLSKVSQAYKHIADTLVSEFHTMFDAYERGQVSEAVFRARYNTLIYQVQVRANELGIEFSDGMKEKLKQFDKFSFKEHNKILEKLLEDKPRVSPVTFNALPTRQIELVSGIKYEDYNFQSSIHKSGIRLGQKLNNVLQEGLAKGWDQRKYVKAIKETAEFTSYEAKRIARTETSRVATESAKRSFKEYGVTKVQWRSSLEKRTCAVCAALNGKKYSPSYAPPLPRHPHCRCYLLPVEVDGEEI
ncbi:minor capsid protein [Bacillus cereus group sp. TH153LC]|uniref:minor capsid protein n=1 Tax=Bacillus cereus group sp. TH153LC TaxID=3018059 RepID=UPI0022E7249A|nr:minor capsid protein [Bacillus cereus group sp. TH153LC]MDA1658816.1 minor capsid protein [Bacillus cereus group sp. TH153LC]